MHAFLTTLHYTCECNIHQISGDAKAEACGAFTELELPSRDIANLVPPEVFVQGQHWRQLPQPANAGESRDKWGSFVFFFSEFLFD